jgi:hypothetical protein
MKRLLLIPVAVVGLMACGDDDDDATSDLDVDLIQTHSGETDVVVNANRFPNFAHTCWETVGFWSTTDRVSIIVYNDWLCPGSSREQDMVVLSGNPRAVVNSSGG